MDLRYIKKKLEHLNIKKINKKKYMDTFPFTYLIINIAPNINFK
mgnify:CR=1 FL=1